MTDVQVTGSTDRWEARVGEESAGTLRAVVRPDDRCFLFFGDCGRPAFGPLLAAATTALDRDLYTVVDDSDEAGLRTLAELGFVVQQREVRYRIPTDPAQYGLGDAASAPGIDLISAADADIPRLQALDEALRQDIPGTDGWRWQSEDFHDETFADPAFDPATYLVAVDRSSGAYVGLLRIWMNPTGPRLGCLGVLPAYRRTRVTRALVARLAHVLHGRGEAEVVTEIATTNRAAQALVARREPSRIGSASQLVLRRRHGVGERRAPTERDRLRDGASSRAVTSPASDHTTSRSRTGAVRR